MKLSDKQMSLLKLIKRSTADVDGWYRVSNLLWLHISGTLPGDLVEERPDGEAGYIRFTARGRALADYA